MHIITQRMLIQGVAKRWHQQYAPFSNGSPPLFSARKGLGTSLTKEGIYQHLEALDKETASAADVANIIGNESWTRMTCDECKSDVDWLLEVGAERDYESSTACLCKECVAKASGMAVPASP